MPAINAQTRGGSARGGSVDTTGEFTLATSGTTTTVHHRGIGPNAVVMLVPHDAGARNEVKVNGPLAIVPAVDQFTVTHTVSATTRTFRYFWVQGPRA